MSSKYMILCLSHDPAIAFGGEDERGVDWRTPQAALDAIADRTGDSPAAGHPNCDLLIGRYSYPLIEVCCPRSRVSGHSGFHPHSDEWVDAGWLRLLALADEKQRKAAGRVSCWLPDTAWRLRHELELDIPPTSSTEQEQTRE